MAEINFSLIEIKQITAEETYAVRHPVLRKGRPLQDCKFEGDNLETTFHFALFYKNSIIGVATFLKNKNALLSKEFQYQLRGMAILEDYQRKNLGGILLQHGEEFLNKEKVQLLWCNAREKAKIFYIQRGYKKIGNPFSIPKIGLHYTMYKQVTNT